MLPLLTDLLNFVTTYMWVAFVQHPVTILLLTCPHLRSPQGLLASTYQLLIPKPMSHILHFCYSGTPGDSNFCFCYLLLCKNLKTLWLKTNSSFIISHDWISKGWAGYCFFQSCLRSCVWLQSHWKDFVKKCMFVFPTRFIWWNSNPQYNDIRR